LLDYNGPGTMAKEKNFNPVQAQRKAEKAREIKKGKATVQAQRNEKLARRNPERLQRQIEELKATDASGNLRPKDRETLSQLEKDVKAIQRAREALGDKAPQFGRREAADRERHDRGPRFDNSGRVGVLGKRRRDGSRPDEDSSETDEDVQGIPMPRDTPPPIPRPARRRADGGNETSQRDDGARGPHELPPKPSPAAQTIYSAAPQIRDLRKEATARFVPAVVQKKLEQVKGQGRLLEPEELDRLEQEGYRDAGKATEAAVQEAQHGMMAVENEMARQEAADTSMDPDQTLKEEEERFERELRKVEIEDVEDEGF
jgi:hypothetical protein